MQVVIRVDSSDRMGSGHLIRCLTLANELRNSGVTVLFVSREHKGNFLQRAEDEGYKVVRLSPPPLPTDSRVDDYSALLGVPQEQDAQECLQALRDTRVDWLVVDHYGLDHVWERHLRAIAPYVAVLDDLANRRHDCDILLDQNYFGSTANSRYAGLVSSSCVQLLGPKYALLQPDYRRLRHLMPARDGLVRRVLVFFGGSDQPNNTMHVLKAFESSTLENLAVDIVAGQNHPDKQGLEDWVGRRRGATLHSGLRSLAGLMARADLAVGGGGSTTWERACLSLPAVIVALADNQRAFSDALAADGYQVLLGRDCDVSVDMWSRALVDQISNPQHLVAMSRRVATLTDGTGSELMARTMLDGERFVVRAKSSLTNSPHSPSGSHVVAAKNLRITVLSDADSWLNAHLTELVARWREQGYPVQWVHDSTLISNGDVCFIIGCTRLLKPTDLSRNTYNLVVHESALPEGRGWSPMTWQVLEDRRHIVITLFEAAKEVDSGRIHLQTTIQLSGTELIDEWRQLQADATSELCSRWINEYPGVTQRAHEQSGTASYFRRRGPVDSRIDPEQSIARQFDLLRVVDNDRYPAFFEYRGSAYRLLIKRAATAQVSNSQME